MNIAQLIKLPTYYDDGFLTVGQSPEIPFKIARFYYIYDCIPGLTRGAHAHLDTKQILFCIRGSVTVTLDDGKNKEKVFLDKPEVGVFLDKMMWHDMINIKKNTLMLVVSSAVYNKDDYIRDYQKFLELSHEQ